MHTNKELAELLGVSESTIYRAKKDPTNENYVEIIERINALGVTMPDGYAGTMKVTDGGKTLDANIILNTNPAKMTEQELREAFDIDETMTLQTLTAKVFNQSSKNDNNEVQVIKNYSTSARFNKAKGWNPTVQDMKDEWNEWIKECPPFTDVPLEFINNIGTDNVLVLPIFDAHIGKMAWGMETGEDYDLKIAGKRYIETITELVIRASHIGVSKIIFPIGQDFLHYTTHDQKTAKGTPQDSDLRWKKMYREGKNLLRDAILFMVDFAPVDLIFSPGNHDEIFSFFLMEHIGDYFRNHPNVNWNGDIKARQYVEIGVNLIGFSHGNEEGNRLFEIMQQEAREAWGRTIYAEWIVGHLHHEKVEEKSGVVRRTVRSISGTDYWHYKKGFIGTLKAGQGIIYNTLKPGPYYILTEPVMKEQ